MQPNTFCHKKKAKVSILLILISILLMGLGRFIYNKYFVYTVYEVRNGEWTELYRTCIYELADDYYNKRKNATPKDGVNYVLMDEEWGNGKADL